MCLSCPECPAAAATPIADPPVPREGQLRIGVLGDEIVVGVGDEALVNAWPWQMARLLRAFEPALATRGVLVKIFPRGGASLDPTSQRWVLDDPAFRGLQAWQPDVVVVALGSADLVTQRIATPRSDPDRPSVPKQLGDGALRLARTLGSWAKPPRVIVCLPPPSNPSWRRREHYDAGVDAFRAALTEAAAEVPFSVLDLPKVLAGTEGTLVQGYLPAGASAERLARGVAAAVAGRDPPAVASHFAPSQPPTGLERIDIIRAGEPLRVVDAARWSREEGAIKGMGAAAPLLADIGTGSGPFRVRWTVRIEGGPGAGPQLGLDDNWLRLEDNAGFMRADGPVFRGRPQIGPAAALWKRGEWIELEVRRAGEMIEYFVNNTLVFAVPAPGEDFQLVRFNPMASTVRVRDFIMEREPSQAP